MAINPAHIVRVIELRKVGDEAVTEIELTGDTVVYVLESAHGIDNKIAESMKHS